MGFINDLFGAVIKFFYDLFNSNYTLALLFFTLVCQILLLPLGIKQQKNSIKQASLAPKAAAIRKRYAGRNDQATQQKAQNEMMELYQSEGYNPAGGCLPLLIQLPIIMFLFNVVRAPLTYILNYSSETIYQVRHILAMEKLPQLMSEAISNGAVKLTELYKTAASTIGYDEMNIAHEMSQMGEEAFSGVAGVVDNFPQFDMFGMGLAQSPAAGIDGGNWWYILIPAVTFVAMYASQWITRKMTYQTPEMKEQQKSTSMRIMNAAMPLMSVYFSYVWSSSMGVYWILRNIFTTVQQIALAKLMPTPVFTEEDYKAAERELAGKNPKKKSGPAERDPNRPAVRSLHYIDADDDDDTPTTAPNNSSVYDSDEDDSTPDAGSAEGDSGRIAPAPLKSDDKKPKKK